jgi:nitrogen regulatory protein PII
VQVLGDVGETRMKLVTAIIKPFKVDEVSEALTDLGASGMGKFSCRS